MIASHIGSRICDHWVCRLIKYYLGYIICNHDSRLLMVIFEKKKKKETKEIKYSRFYTTKVRKIKSAMDQ